MTSNNPVLDEFNKHPLASFLNARRAGEGGEATMTGMGAKKGTWSISDEDYPTLLNLLNDYLFVKQMTPMNFVEQSRSDSAKPILIDLDFKYGPQHNLTRKFSETHIRSFNDQIIEGLNAFYDLSSYGEGLRFFITLRQSPYKDKNGVVKDGIHIECPDLCLSNEKQKVLRNWLLENHSIAGAFEGTGYSNKEDEIYDAAMVRKQGWFFYGESKPNIHPYRLTHVFHYDPETGETDLQDTSVYTPRKLMDLLSVRYNLVEDDNEVRTDARELYTRFLTWRPAALGGGAAAVPHEVESQPVRAVDPETQLIIRTMLNSMRGCAPEDMPLIRSLVMECLSDHRTEDYNEWIEVGLCLHHIASTSEMSDHLFDLWMDFSQKSPKFKVSEIGQRKREWDRWNLPTSDRALKWASLNRWAREDNPAKYKEINDSDIVNFIMAHIMNTHFHIACVMQKMFGSQYKASVDTKKTEWFMYSPHHHVWRHIKQGFELRGKISHEVVEMFQKARNKLVATAEKDPITGEFVSDRVAKQAKEFLAVEKSLYTAPFKDSVMKECANLFYDEDFLNKLNLNPYLIVCRNGVLNLRAERKFEDGRTEYYADFRPGRPEDMMSFVAGGQENPIEYKPFDPTDPNAVALDEFLNLVYPYPELKEYVLTLMSSCLEGMNREQCYYTMTGGGGNGKSKMLELMRVCLGDYQGPLASTVLTRKRPESGAANPDIMSIKNKRFIYLNEPDENEPLNTSRMKQFSGEDLVEARGLFADQEKFKVSGKLFMLCNTLPPIHAMDRGTWRRIRVIPHPSTFVDENDPGWEHFVAGVPNFHRKDTSIDTKVFTWRECFFGLLVKQYETVYCKGLMREPKIVKDASAAYKEKHDSYAKFRNARIRKMPGERSDFNLIMRAYRAWCELQGHVGKKLSAQDLQKRLIDEFGAPVEGRVFAGIKYFDDDDDVADWDKDHPTRS